jgi:nucleoside-diphosphate-sugar epimerase
MKRILLTGATGFVGANLARRLLLDGHEVHLLARPNYTVWRIQAVQDDLHLHVARLEDADDTLRVVDHVRPEWIFHLAAHGAYSWQTDLPQMFQTNFIGTVNLVEACLKTGFEVFVNTGSSSEYGFKDHAPTENENPEPNSHYAVTKVSGTLYCGYVARRHSVRIPTLRLYSVYGPYEEPKRLIPTLMVHGLRGTMPPLVSPHIARDYVHIEDVLDAYASVVASTNTPLDGIYNVGTGIQTTVGKIVEITQQILGNTAKPEWGSMSERTWDTNVWVADIHYIKKTLRWAPAYTIENGLRLTANWLQENPAVYDYYCQQVLG